LEPVSEDYYLLEGRKERSMEVREKRETNKGGRGKRYMICLMWKEWGAGITLNLSTSQNKKRKRVTT